MSILKGTVRISKMLAIQLTYTCCHNTGIGSALGFCPSSRVLHILTGDETWCFQYDPESK
jgi:hypothetical protein